MIPIDGIVPSLPKQNAGMIPEVNNGIPHKLHTLLPLPAKGLPLLIACRLSTHYSKAVKCPDIRRGSCHMHETDVIGVTLPNQFGIHVPQPVRRTSQSSPFVCSSLGISGKPYFHVVDLQPFSTLISDFPKAGFHLLYIHRFPIAKQRHTHAVKVRIVNIPESHIRYRCKSGERLYLIRIRLHLAGRLFLHRLKSLLCPAICMGRNNCSKSAAAASGSQVLHIPHKLCRRHTVPVKQFNLQGSFPFAAAFVAYFRLHMDHCLPRFRIKIGTIHIDSLCL